MRLALVAMAYISLAVLCPASSLAADAPPAFDLDWTAPDDCPSRTRIVSEIGTLVGPSSPGKKLRAVAVVSRTTTGGWQSRITTEWEGGSDTRSLEGESCEAVAEATSLFIALALDRPEAGRQSDAAAASAPEPPVAPVPSPAPLPMPPREPAPARPALPLPPLSLSAASRLDTSTLPRAAVGAELGVGWRPRPLLVEAAGTYWSTENASLPASDLGGRYQMLTGTLRACYELQSPSFMFGPCAAGELDRVSADGYGKMVTESGATSWLGLAVGGVGAWKLARWGAVRALVEADLPLSRPSFLVENADARYRVSAASLRAGLGFELKIP